MVVGYKKKVGKILIHRVTPVDGWREGVNCRHSMWFSVCLQWIAKNCLLSSSFAIEIWKRVLGILIINSLSANCVYVGGLIVGNCTMGPGDQCCMRRRVLHMLFLHDMVKCKKQILEIFNSSYSQNFRKKGKVGIMYVKQFLVQPQDDFLIMYYLFYGEKNTIGIVSFSFV